MRLIKLAGTTLPALISVLLVHGQEIPLPKPLPKVDSVRSSLERQVKEKAAGISQQLMPVDTGLVKRTLQAKKQELSKLWSETQQPLQEVFSKVKIFSGSKLIRLTGTEVKADYSHLNDSTGVALGAFQDLRSIYNYTVNSGVALFDMPFGFSFRGQNGVYAFQRNPFDQLLKFNFDHKKYLETIRSKVAEKLSPEVVTAALTNRINSLRSGYEAKLKKEIASMKDDFVKEYKTSLQLPEDITDLRKTDMNALRSKLVAAGGLGDYEASAGKIQEAIKKGSVSMQDTALLKDMGVVKQREMMEKILQKVVRAKESFENNKLVKELKSHLPFTADNYKEFLKNPGNLTKLLDGHVDMNLLQRLFVNVTQLDLGQNPVQGGDFGLQNLINTGINTTFKNKSTTVGVLYGKNNNVNNWMQAGLTSAISNEYSSVSGFTLGSGTGSKIEKSISLNFFNFNGSPGTDTREGMLRAAYLGVPPRKDATITVHTGYTLAGKHKIGVDVSKSFGSFNDHLSADSVLQKVNAHNEVFSGNGSSNLAAMVDYTGELFETDVRVFVKKVGLGYNNPGNSSLRRGETQVGAAFGRKWLRNRLTTRYNVDYRKQTFDPLKRYTHTTLNNKVQVGYKIRRNNRIGITYQRSDYNSQLFVGEASRGGNVRLQLDGGYEFKLAGKKLMNNVALSHQEMNVPMLVGQQYKGTNVMFMHTSTVLVKKSPLSVQLLVNRSDNSDYLFNTSMLNLETNYSYPVSANIRFGSGLGYYSNTGWNRQVGGRQQLSAVLLRNLNLDVELSYRKAVHIDRPELADQLFITAGAHFNF